MSGCETMPSLSVTPFVTASFARRHVELLHHTDEPPSVTRKIQSHHV